MTRREALERIGEMLEIPPQELKEDLTPAHVAAWDSMGHINILAFLDDEFGICLSAEEMDNVNSLRSVLDIIHERGGFSA